MKKINMLEIQQPIGSFYVGKMFAKDIIAISKVSQRHGNFGHQRQLKEKRAKEIAMYCKDPDATFPTPIILSVSSNAFSIVENSLDGFVCFEYDETNKSAELLDGQHRIAGIEKAINFDYELPVIFMFDLTEEQKAYVFSIINGTQVKVDKSLIFDLFDLNEAKSPYKTCHQIARALNSDPHSPFYRRLKMLEKREHSSETISQSTFVSNLCGLISVSPQEDAIRLKQGMELVNSPDGKTVFRKYFINNHEDVILKILSNYYGAAADIFKHEWNNPQEYVLTKTVGFSGMMMALKELVPQGEKAGNLSRQFFIPIFKTLKKNMERDGLQITSAYFPSSGQSATKLAKLLIEASNQNANNQNSK